MTKTETPQGDHTFDRSGFVDYLLRPICSQCSQIERHVRHIPLEGPSDEAKAFEARWLGEQP